MTTHYTGEQRISIRKPAQVSVSIQGHPSTIELVFSCRATSTGEIERAMFEAKRMIVEKLIESDPKIKYSVMQLKVGAEVRFPDDRWEQMVWMTLVERGCNRDRAQEAIENYGYEPFGKIMDELEDIATS